MGFEIRKKKKLERAEKFVKKNKKGIGRDSDDIKKDIKVS